MPCWRDAEHIDHKDCNCSLCWWVSPRESAGGKQSHISAIRITQSSDSGIYLTQDRCSKMENFPENSLLLLHRAPPPPPSLCQGPVVESCDPDIVVTLEHWHNYTLLHPQPAPVAVAHHNKSNPSTTADTRLDFFINNISSQLLSGVWRGEEAISNISAAAGSQGLGWNK